VFRPGATPGKAYLFGFRGREVVDVHHAQTVGEVGKLRVGEWLVTDDSSRAEIHVGEIGRFSGFLFEKKVTQDTPDCVRVMCGGTHL